MTNEALTTISKYGFAAIAAAALAVYYRIDVVLPAREQNKSLLEVNQQQAKTQDQQTKILAAMAGDIQQIKQDQRKFPAVADAAK